MKKILGSIIITLLASAAFAVDFGGSILNYTVLRDRTADTELKLDQTNSLGVWLSIPFDNDGNTTLAASAKAEYEKDYASDEQTIFADLDIFRLTHRGKNTSFMLGRFNTADTTGVILNQTIDGVYLAYNSDAFSAGLTGAYTGLINRHFNTILNEIPVSYMEDNDKIYELAEKYCVGNLLLSFPYLFAGQSVSLENLFTLHLEDDSYMRNYSTLTINGGLGSSVYYTLSSALELSKFDDMDLEMANLSKFSLSYYASAKSFAVELKGVYASGNQGPFKPFKGFTSMTAVNSNTGRTQYSNLAKGGLGFSFKPVTSLLFAANAAAVLNPEDSFSYAGFEYSAGLNWQIVSDILVAGKVSMYFDSENSDMNKNEFSLTALITF